VTDACPVGERGDGRGGAASELSKKFLAAGRVAIESDAPAAAPAAPVRRVLAQAAFAALGLAAALAVVGVSLARLRRSAAASANRRRGEVYLRAHDEDDRPFE